MAWIDRFTDPFACAYVHGNFCMVNIGTCQILLGAGMDGEIAGVIRNGYVQRVVPDESVCHSRGYHIESRERVGKTVMIAYTHHHKVKSRKIRAYFYKRACRRFANVWGRQDSRFSFVR